MYMEGGNTGKYGKYFAEISLPHSVTNNRSIGNKFELQLKSYEGCWKNNK